ncbi:MAG TPA: hypothetical protein VF546_10410 [Pyrinomonadaceae bacterium]|jgi:hypothetical protein
MSTREQVLEELETLSEEELEEVAEYLAFLRYRARSKPPVLDDAQLAALYGEFADEDRELAEAGLEDYAADLQAEDVK